MLAGPLLAFLLGACTGSASTVKTLDRTGEARFANLLVIGVASDYDGRAMFERTVVSRLRAAGADASAYYTLLGRNPPVTRASVQRALDAGEFDAVLVTRLKDQMLGAEVRPGPAGAKATVKGGGPVNLFRYDYEELDEPEIIEFSATVVLATELYDVTDGDPIWAIETTSRDKANVGELVDSAADAIVGRLRRDRLIGD